MAAEELMSIREAARRGIERLRKTNWSNPMDHIKLDIVNGLRGPWLHLYSPFNMECNGRDPVEMLAIQGVDGFDGDAREFVAYSGPLPDSPEYRRAVETYGR